MIKRVYKYPLEIGDTIVVSLPRDYRILRVDFQDDILCCWALVDPVSQPVDVKLIMAGSGSPIESHRAGAHINTVFWRGLDFHIFEDCTNGELSP